MNQGKLAFHFREFTVRQERSAMKVGTDGVLLGAWAEVHGSRKILDIGTGTGIIALMIAQRAPDAEIHAIEPEINAFEEASYNFRTSPWAERLFPRHSRLQDMSEQFDCLISNPPYFESHLETRDKARTTARHATGLTLEELAKFSKNLLAPDGQIHVILPVEEGLRFIDIAIKKHLFLRHQCIVFSDFKKPVRRMMSFRHEPGPVFQEILYIRKNGHYTDAYLRLTRDFYISLPEIS